VEYATDLFERADVEELCGRLLRLLEGAVGDPERAIGRLDLLAAAERARLLGEFAGGAVVAGALGSATLVDRFAAQAAARGDAVAVVFGDARLSYRELDARSNQLAHHLRERGVGAEVVVGLCLERSLELVVGLLAILKAGGAYLPLDPSYPQPRLAFMLQDAGARVLLTRAGLRGAPAAPAPEIEIVCLERDADTIAQAPTTPAPLTLAPHNAAYVIYTSGSTGTPKGVVVGHGALANHMAWMLAEYPLAAQDVVLGRTAISFDAAQWELWLPLLSGASLCVAPLEVTQDVLA